MSRETAFDRRTSGVLLHVTSLPGPHGSGDLSAEAFRFVDQLAAAGQTWWQMLPINPPGAGNSPYSSSSIHAGAPLLIDLHGLIKLGLLKRSELAAVPRFNPGVVDFPKTQLFRERHLRQAHARFLGRSDADRAAYETFRLAHADWLEDETLFSALKQYCGGLPWYRWPAALRDRRPKALAEMRERLADEIDYHRFIQFLFDQQWAALHTYANSKHVKLIGDVPIFVSHDSVPVWRQPKLWQLDSNYFSKAVSGAPPDYFSAEGQRWGHPQYAWPRHEQENFAWWIDRFATMLRFFDAVRIDHFLGFARLWSIPAEKPAKQGKWVNVPGRSLLALLRETFGHLPVIAEDLGELTPAAAALRDDFGLPGMRVLQFGFGETPGGDYHRPHAWPVDSVAYTGTHDNDTIAGFIKASSPAARARLSSYTGGATNWSAVRAVMASRSNTAIFPLQDLLNSPDRMNYPGEAEGNWAWRYKREDLTPAIVKQFAELTKTFDRISS